MLYLMTISVSCEAASSAANLGALSLTARTCYGRICCILCLFQYRVKLLAVLPILVPCHSQLEHVMLEYAVSYDDFSNV